MSKYHSRRKFIAYATAATLSPIANIPAPDFEIRSKFPISCNTYNWTTFFHRQGLKWNENLNYSIGQFAKSGIEAIEPAFTSAGEVREIVPYLDKYSLQMPSAYVNSILHDYHEADRSIEQVLAIALELKKSGTKILVTNPSPIKWGTKTTKDDSQIKLQTEKLDILGKELKEMGITLAYHTHDIELRGGAREFHHVLQNTDPGHVHFCLDAHWVYRGCENSSLALFDIIKMYGKRIVELHIRQSHDGIWTEAFGEGDIDYHQVAQIFSTHKIKPHLVIEQAVEQGSPNTLNAIEAHRISLIQVQNIFSSIL